MDFCPIELASLQAGATLSPPLQKSGWGEEGRELPYASSLNETSVAFPPAAVVLIEIARSTHKRGR